MGSPLGAKDGSLSAWKTNAIHVLTEPYIAPDSVENLSDLKSVEKWWNYWMACDVITGDDGFVTAKKTLNIELTGEPDNCHSFYHDDDAVYEAIIRKAIQKK